MKSKNNIRTLSIMLSIAVILLTVAFVTITKSFALPNKIQDKIFNVRITDINSTGISLNDIRVANTNVFLNVHLNYTNPSNSFVMDVTNNGNIDAKIKNINSSFLENDYLFEYNNNKYYLKDFVVYKINYASKNITNGITMDADLRENDNLLVGTRNKVKVSFRLKKNSELSEEEIAALDYYLKDSDINRSISLNIDYQEK